MTTTAYGGTTPPENTPPTLAMATSAPALKRENALMNMPDMCVCVKCGMEHVDYHDGPLNLCTPCLESQNREIALMNQGNRNYVEMHNALVRPETAAAAPCTCVGGWHIGQGACHPDPYRRRSCTVCGHADSPSVIYVWYDDLRDRVCGDCFAWACQAMRTIKVQRFYV